MFVQEVFCPYMGDFCWLNKNGVTQSPCCALPWSESRGGCLSVVGEKRMAATLKNGISLQAENESLRLAVDIAATLQHMYVGMMWCYLKTHSTMLRRLAIKYWHTASF
jgi:hypothetical protein